MARKQTAGVAEVKQRAGVPGDRDKLADLLCSGGGTTFVGHILYR